MPHDLAPQTSQTRARRLGEAMAGLEAPEALARALASPLAGRTALVSAFGAESAALLHIVARIDRDLPVLFIDTGMLFGQTLAYQRRLARHLGLRELRVVTPEREEVFARDPDTLLHRFNPDACCQVRKIAPLRRALAGFDTWITGRKRFQNGLRVALPLVEPDGAARVKINPLAEWAPGEAARYIARHGLPRHPLVARGYPSIGCAPCTTPVKSGEDLRAGRWRGEEKQECGIHFADPRPRQVTDRDQNADVTGEAA